MFLGKIRGFLSLLVWGAALVAAAADVRVCAYNIRAADLEAPALSPGVVRAVSPSPVPGAVGIESVLARMTTDEKIGQLCQVAVRDPDKPGLREGIASGKWGSVIWNPIRPELRNEFQKLAVEGRKNGVPLLFCLDVIHGARTVFPIAPALAGSFDMEMIEKVQRIAAREAAAAGIGVVFSPMADLAVDPRWGRVAETCGEDPYLSSLAIAAQVRGFQGHKPMAIPSDRVAACIKHFVGYGASVGGRDYNEADVNFWDLRNKHLPQYKAGVEAGAWAIMSSFNTVDGIPSAANRLTLTDILRGEWGFKGFVVSDWGGVGETIQWGYARDEQDAAAKCLTAGNDIDMCSDAFPKGLKAAVEAGRVTQAALDEAVLRVLRVKAALGLFARPYIDESLNEQEVARYGRYLEFAAQVVPKCSVLLKNRNEILPLALSGDKAPKRIALIGPGAVESRDYVGCWIHAGFGKHKSAPKLADEFRKALPPDVELTVEQGCASFSGKGTKVLTDGNVVPDGSDEAKNEDASIARAVKAAERADVVVLALAEASGWTGENGSRRSLGLTGRQQELFDRVVALRKPVVTVVGAGRPLSLNRVWDESDAVLWVWQPGSAAAMGIARMLVGAAAPEGRLTMSIPKDVSQVPVNYNHPVTGRPTRGNYREDGNSRRYARVEERFGFGYGLTYSKFEYRNPRIEGDAAKVELANVGGREATEVVQLYVRATYCAEGIRPVKELRDFARVTLAPGETRTVSFALTPEKLGYVGRDGRQKVDAGDYRIYIASEATSGRELNYVYRPLKARRATKDLK